MHQQHLHPVTFIAIDKPMLQQCNLNGQEMKSGDGAARPMAAAEREAAADVREWRRSLQGVLLGSMLTGRQQGHVPRQQGHG